MARRSTVPLLVVCLPWIVVGCSRPLSTDQTEQFAQAQQLFDNAVDSEDFLLAAASFQKLRDDGVNSGAVLFNQGNAYARAGERGRALACYLQAQRFWPRDQRLAGNLDIVGGAELIETESPIQHRLLLWQDLLSYPAKIRISLGLTATTLVGVLVVLLRPSRLGKRLLTTVAVVAVGVLLWTAFDFYRYDVLSHGILVGEDATLRKGAAASYAPVVSQPLREGSLVQILERRSSWFLVIDVNRNEGWLAREHLVPL